MIKEYLSRLKEEDRYRTIPAHCEEPGIYNLTLNDYMGLGQEYREYMPEFIEKYGVQPMTSSASRLLASNQDCYTRLEHYLSASYGKPALLFNSGYHANTGIVGALNLPGTLWVPDKLIHASVTDGLKMCGAETLRWKHNDTAHLKKILERNAASYERIIIVCESIYSMDGDIAPLAELVRIKKEFPGTMLYVDEAHAIGCIGPKGLGVAMREALVPEIDILVGTLGKACASAGAFAITGELVHDFLINTARSLIFSTALPPINIMWSLFMLEKLAGMDRRREHLASISAKFKEGVERITGRQNPSESAIIPMPARDAADAVAMSATLSEEGILALPIRRPTVPPGGERIRFSLNANLSDQDINNILTRIEKIAGRK